MQPHDFRTSRATHLNGKIDLKSLQTVLGHKNIQTTQGYVKQTVQDLKAELSFDLLDKKNRRWRKTGAINRKSSGRTEEPPL